MQVYLVGGAVRDQLLGRPVLERDWVVVGATPEIMIKLGYKPVGKDFPVFLHPDTKEEYALARTERKTGKGYTGFIVHASPNVTLEEDLERRDLTINAIAQANDGTLIDPFHGQQDIEKQQLRHVSVAFAEDPVRILRLARFAARFPTFQVAPDTMTLMQNMTAAGEVDALVPERVWKELSRALGESQPSRFFHILVAADAAPRLFPELLASQQNLTPDSTQQTSPLLIDQQHAAPKQATKSRPIQSASLLALEKSTTLTQASHIRFAALMGNLSSTAIKSACKRFNAPRQYQDLALLVSQHATAYQQLVPEAEPTLRLLQRLDAFRRPERLADFFLACQALVSADQTQQQQRLLAGLSAALTVDTKKLLALGLEHQAFADALAKERLLAIQRLFKAE